MQAGTEELELSIKVCCSVQHEVYFIIVAEQFTSLI